MATVVSASSRRMHATPIDPIAFAPFGTVVQNPESHGGRPAGIRRSIANQGTATKWHNVTNLRDYYNSCGNGASRSHPAQPAISMFTCKPRRLRSSANDDGTGLFDVRVLERHPFTSQTFVPLGLSGADTRTCYLVVVAPTLSSHAGSWPASGSSASSAHDSNWPRGPGLPDLDHIRAFVVHGDQAVTYGPGTWHAPMVVLGDRSVDFVVVQFANQVAEDDCQEVEIVSERGTEGIAVEVHGIPNRIPLVHAKL